MQWAEVNGRTKLLVGGAVNEFIPNPTFDRVSARSARSRTPVRRLFGREHIDDSVERLRRVVRVQRREHQAAGLGERERDGDASSPTSR